MSRVAIILAEGLEEVEAVTPIDFLRRAGINVVTVGLTGREITGAHGVTILADTALTDFDGKADCILIPGGMPGAANIAASRDIVELVRVFYEENRLVAAICAAPALVLGKAAGILKNRSYTCYPGMESEAGSEGRYTGERVVEDGNLITGCGPGGAAEFAAAVISALAGKSKADEIMRGTLQAGC